MAVVTGQSINGLETKIHLHNDGNGTVTFETSQDAQPILENAKNLRSHGLVGSNEMRHAARLPAAAIELYCNQRNLTFQDFMADKKHIRAMLNDPDLKGFRVWEGRV